MIIKKFILSMLSTALIFSTVTGCSSPDTDTDANTDESSEVTTNMETSADEITQVPETQAPDPFLPKDKEYSVLFVGNSYTFYNDMPEVIFKTICDKAGYSVKVDSVTRGGYYLHQFASSRDEYGAELENKLAQNEYDFIVLQEQSGNPAYNPNNFFSGARTLVRKIRRSSDAEIVFFETWGYKTGYHLLPTHGGDTATMEMKNRAAYTAIAEYLHAEVALVGVAFKDVFENSRVEVYDADHSHPSKNGSVLAACTIFSTIFKHDIRDVNFEVGVSRNEIKVLKNAAYNAVFEDHPVDRRYKLEVE